LFATFDANDSDADLLRKFRVLKLTFTAVRDEDSRPNAPNCVHAKPTGSRAAFAALLNDPTPSHSPQNSRREWPSELRPAGPAILSCVSSAFDVQEYESALRRYGLDYYLVGGKAFFRCREVFDLTELCQYLDDL